MAVALECLGLAELGDALIPAEDRAEKAAAAARAGRRAVALAGTDRTARRFLGRRALRNAMAGVAASGGSTNGVLHLLAIAREAGVELTQDELTELAARTPVLASLSPGGRHVAETMHRAGGTPTLIRELIAGGHFDGEAPTVAGATFAAATADAPAPDGEVLFAHGAPFKPERRAADAARQPRARRQPREGRGRRAHAPDRAGARVRRRVRMRHGRARGARAARRRARRPLRGPRGRAGDARDALRDVVRRRRRPGGVGRARDRRALLRRDARADGRPRLARGGARRAARGGARRRRDHDRRRRRRAQRRRARRGAARPPEGLGAARRGRRRTGSACSPATAPRSARPPTAPSCAPDAGARRHPGRRRQRRGRGDAGAAAGGRASCSSGRWRSASAAPTARSRRACSGSRRRGRTG